MKGEHNTHLTRCMETALQNRQKRGIKRELNNTPCANAAVDLSSNDFLSLATSSAFRTKYLDNLTRASATCRLASTGSRLLDGNSAYAEELEKFIVGFHDAPDGLLFNSGFHANVGVFACVPQPGDVIVYDELIHASTHDGMRLSRAGKRVPFRHNSIDGLEEVLRSVRDNDPLVRDGSRSVFIAVESIYSMDGDFAPISEMLGVIDAVLPQRNGHMIVDEAHATGVFGPQGSGMVQMLGVQDRVFVRLHTFGKALASNGAIALCSSLTKSYLLNYARPLIFSSSLGLPSLVSIRTAYELLTQGATEQVGKGQPIVSHKKKGSHKDKPQLQSQLQELITFLDKGLDGIYPPEKDALLKVKHHPSSPIFALQTPFPRELAKLCQERGFMVRAIMPPTVPKGTQRIRVCLHAGNTMEDIQQFIETVRQWVSENQQEKLRL